MAQQAIKFILDKKGNMRAYRYSWRQMRWFPLPLIEAEKAVKAGEAKDVTGERWTICPGLKGQVHV